MQAILLAVLAGLCWGVGEVFTRSVLHTGQIGPITAIAARSTVALPILWLVWVWFVPVHGREPLHWISGSTPSTLAKLALGSGVMAGALGMILFYWALSQGEVSRIKPIAFSVAPATAVFLGWLVLRESMTLSKAMALGLILAGVVLLTMDKKGHAPATPEAASGEPVAHSARPASSPRVEWAVAAASTAPGVTDPSSVTVSTPDAGAGQVSLKPSAGLASTSAGRSSDTGAPAAGA